MRKTAPRRRHSVARVLLRLPVGLHRSLVRAATTAGLSFNEYCARRLAEPEPAGGLAAGAPRAAVLAAALAGHGDRLLGLIVIGSWARGDVADGSDIDVLVVLDPAVPLTRALYRAWDETAPVVPDRALDVHFVHPPPPDGLPGAVWCEAAVDGLVWFDRDGRIAQSLAAVRRAIAAGRVVRSVAHGQPYWKEVA